LSNLQLALKIDVDTLRGTREGVPALVDALKLAQADATFLFSLGPDHTGRALRRVFRRGMFDFARKVSRTSVLEHYGLRTLLYGTLLPGPDIGRRAGDVMRSVRDAGYEVGVHCYDHTTWQDYVSRRGEAWTRDQMLRAVHRFREVFGAKPQVHGAAGWQMNDTALELEQELEFVYASDTRGTGAVRAAAAGAPQRRSRSAAATIAPRRSACPQLPTTLPTLDELIGVGAITADNVHEELLARTSALRTGHVFTLACGARRHEAAAGIPAADPRLACAGLPAGVDANAVPRSWTSPACQARGWNPARCRAAAARWRCKGPPGKVLPAGRGRAAARADLVSFPAGNGAEQAGGSRWLQRRRPATARCFRARWPRWPGSRATASRSCPAASGCAASRST
jgi:undecaprenyl phosphate-alpha-L-ara4FN deformylase